MTAGRRAKLRRLSSHPSERHIFLRTAAPSRRLRGRKKAQPFSEAGLLSFWGGQERVPARRLETAVLVDELMRVYAVFLNLIVHDAVAGLQVARGLEHIAPGLDERVHEKLLLEAGHGVA